MIPCLPKRKNQDNNGSWLGRNFWGVPIEEDLKLSAAVTEIMQRGAYKRKL